MEKLNIKIAEMRNKIIDICLNIHSIENNTFQDAIAAYTWNLLDSYVAWRTLRYLLRDTIIDDEVDEKWYSTPSSYRCASLKPIWKFGKVVEELSKNECGKKFSSLIDDEIQKNRNSGAHYKNEVSSITGSDIENKIKKYFIFLDKLFFIYELNATINNCFDMSNKIVLEIVAFPIDDNKNIISFVPSKIEELKIEDKNMLINCDCLNKVFNILSMYELGEIKGFAQDDETNFFKCRNTIKISVNDKEFIFTNKDDIGESEKKMTLGNGIIYHIIKED